MVSITIAVEHPDGAPPASKAGSLLLDDTGVTFDDSSGDPARWTWRDARLEFEPPIEPGERTGVAAVLAAVGLDRSKKHRPGLRVFAGQTELAFELPNVEGDLGKVAARIVQEFPAAAGRISVRNQILG